MPIVYSLKKRCPECNSRDVRRSMRRGFCEICLLPFALLRPFRCERCDARFLGFWFTTRFRGKARNQTQPGNVSNNSEAASIPVAPGKAVDNSHHHDLGKPHKG
jgi:endogenous inhibitor of DNA gyrase (YacG/DUF329 family)